MDPALLKQMHGAVAFFVVLAIAVLWGGYLLYKLSQTFADELQLL